MTNGAVADDEMGALRAVPTLEGLYQETAKMNVRPGWLQREEPA